MSSTTQPAATDLEAEAQAAEAAALVARQSARIDRERRDREAFMANLETTGQMESYRAWHDRGKDLTRLNAAIAEAWTAFSAAVHADDATFLGIRTAHGRWSRLRFAAARRSIYAQTAENSFNPRYADTGRSTVAPWNRRYGPVDFSTALDQAMGERYAIDEAELRADPSAWQPDGWPDGK